MKTKRSSRCLCMLAACLLVLPAGAQTLIEGFEYADDAALLAAWSPQSATLGLSTSVASHSTGTKSLRLDRTFTASTWDTEILTGPVHVTPVAIGTAQYVTFRVAGDAQFTNSTFNMLYVYAVDGAGNFGRWGAPVPTTNNWQVVNFSASAIEKPWDSPGLPDLNSIVQFKFYLYGQGDPAGAAFTATVYVDDLMVRDTPLVEVQPTTGPQTIEDFEPYVSDLDLYAVWSPMSGALSLSPYVAKGSKGTNSLRVDRNFSSTAWETEVLSSPARAIPMSIAPTQYLTFRVAGDPQFTNASWQTLYLYAFDGANNFGRWGAPVPTSTNWENFNFVASSIEKPWNSTALPDLKNIVQFKFYLYGQGDPAGAAFSSTIYIDDVAVRDTALIEFPPASPLRTSIDDFEGYADDTALMGFYSYVNSPAATLSTASIQNPAPQGTKALKLAIDFSSGQYPWGSVRSTAVTSFSLPTNATVQCSFKGDPTLAPVADDGTTFWLTFYDGGGRSINFTTSAPVTNANWITLKARYQDFWSTTPVDTGNLVQWRLLVQGWTGTASSTALSGTFYVDNIKVTIPPVLSVIRESGALKLKLDSLIPGTVYTLRQTPDFSSWTTSTITATATSQTWTIPPGQNGCYQLFYTP